MGQQFDRNNPGNMTILKTEKKVQKNIIRMINEYISKYNNQRMRLTKNNFTHCNPLTPHLYYKFSYLYMRTFLNFYKENSDLLQHLGESNSQINYEFENSESDESLSKSSQSISEKDVEVNSGSYKDNERRSFNINKSRNLSINQSNKSNNISKSKSININKSKINKSRSMFGEPNMISMEKDSSSLSSQKDISNGQNNSKYKIIINKSLIDSKNGDEISHNDK